MNYSLIILLVLIPVSLIALGIFGFKRKKRKNDVHFKGYSEDYLISKEIEIYKKIGNQKNPSFKNYSEWREHITNNYKTIIEKDSQKGEDFYRFLNQRFRYENETLDMCKAIAFPGCIALITPLAALNKSRLLNEDQIDKIVNAIFITNNTDDIKNVLSAVIKSDYIDNYKIAGYCFVTSLFIILYIVVLISKANLHKEFIKDFVEIVYSKEKSDSLG